jgi:hypothetical protein
VWQMERHVLPSHHYDPQATIALKLVAILSNLGCELKAKTLKSMKTRKQVAIFPPVAAQRGYGSDSKSLTFHCSANRRV